MIEFMVISGERSGSTWAANWLTTDTTICFHDPLRRWPKEELDSIFPLMRRRKGVACTALQMEPEWVNNHPAKKLVIVRDVFEIEMSWHRHGVKPSPLTRGTLSRLMRIDGFHVDFKNLFDPETARDIAKHLEVPFDFHRHQELMQMNVQPHWPAVVQTRTL